MFNLVDLYKMKLARSRDNKDTTKYYKDKIKQAEGHSKEHTKSLEQLHQLNKLKMDFVNKKRKKV